MQKVEHVQTNNSFYERAKLTPATNDMWVFFMALRSPGFSPCSLFCFRSPVSALRQFKVVRAGSQGRLWAFLLDD